MTRKHFKAIAAAIREARSNAANAPMWTPQDAIERLARDIANVCADANGNFDHAKFMRATRGEK